MAVVSSFTTQKYGLTAGTFDRAREPAAPWLPGRAARGSPNVAPKAGNPSLTLVPCCHGCKRAIAR